MDKLKRDDLFSLEKYAEVRQVFRKKVIDHKKQRIVHLGPVASLYFEDRLTMHYQIQEMLRVERIFEAAGIEEELAAYNPLVPDGSNWKATFMIEIEDPVERARMLSVLVGVEDHVWVRIGGLDPVYAIADEDMERETAEKTSSVHFMRFELTPEMLAAAKNGDDISMGINHDLYSHNVEQVPPNVRASLLADLA